MSRGNRHRDTGEDLRAIHTEFRIPLGDQVARLVEQVEEELFAAGQGCRISAPLHVNDQSAAAGGEIRADLGAFQGQSVGKSDAKDPPLLGMGPCVEFHEPWPNRFLSRKLVGTGKRLPGNVGRFLISS